MDRTRRLEHLLYQELHPYTDIACVQQPSPKKGRP
jgi:hypothetical protein